MKRLVLPYTGLLLLGLVLVAGDKAASSPVRFLRTQKVGDLTYFRVSFEQPKDLAGAENPDERAFRFFSGPTGSLAPRLVAADNKIRLVYQRNAPRRNRLEPIEREFPLEKEKGDFKEKDVDEPPSKDKSVRSKLKDKLRPKPKERRPRGTAPVEGIEFVGRTEATGEVKMKLLYPVRAKNKLTWKETEVTLDFAKAKKVAIPEEAAERKEEPRTGTPQYPPVGDDLEGLWAVAQCEHFTALADEVHEFGFYSFAAMTTARKFGVYSALERNWGNWRWRDRAIDRFDKGGPGHHHDFVDRQLYETTTGAAAITESLAMRRMNTVAPRAEKRRVTPIATLKGIEIAEHPWKKMMGDKKPADEPCATMVPHDNYYIHFKRIAKFMEFTELVDQWGTNLIRAYEVTSRDNRLKERYHQQLCLRSTALGKTMGPFVIKGVAITGNDAYLREGSDLALIFEVTQKKLFYSAVDGFITEARKKFGKSLKESESTFNEVKIQSFVTPTREVSLHRCEIGNNVIYANSIVGAHRIIQTHQGKGKRLADSLDFQYMRTIFRYDDKEEDGFAFLSDAFIRNLVGPASKIKERRRLEALASLHMLTHGAMYTAWENGKAPASEKVLMETSVLREKELPMPEGKAAVWDAENNVAVSDVYNTMHFATPLIELPIDNVTDQEAAEYERFRLEYMGLWRQFFDPIGMRVSLRDNQVKMDTYILPLIRNSQYNELRRITGEKSVRFDPTSISSKTLGRYLVRLSGDADERRGWFGGLVPGGGFDPWMMLAWAADPVGDWFMVRLDDSDVYAKLFALAKKQDDGERVSTEEVARQMWSVPFAIGVDVKNPLVFAGTLAGLRTSLMNALPGAVTWEPLEKAYKDVSIVRIKATARGRGMLGPIAGEEPDKKDPFLPAIYYAMIDGAFYLTLNENMMHSLIDAAKAKREKKDTVEVATSLYLSPKAAEKTGPLLKMLLERQTHSQAISCLPVWTAMYKSGIVAEDAKPEQAQEAAYRYLGYVPMSPDGSAYKFDRANDEVVNERHGTLRKPIQHLTTAEKSPVNFLLEQLKSVRADLRFREDGIHTVLTIKK